MLMIIIAPVCTPLVTIIAIYFISVFVFRSFKKAAIALSVLLTDLQSWIAFLWVAPNFYFAYRFLVYSGTEPGRIPVYGITFFAIVFLIIEVIIVRILLKLFPNEKDDDNNIDEDNS